MSHLHPETPVEEEALDMLIERATAVESVSLRLRGDKDGVVSARHVGPTVQRYAAYVRQKKALDELFTKHDADGSGTLECSELLGIMMEYAVKGGVHVAVDEDDVNHVLEACDKDGDQTVSRIELLPALATWRDIVSERRTQAREEEHVRIQAEAERVQAEKQAEKQAEQQRKQSERERKSKRKPSRGGSERKTADDAALDGANGAAPDEATKAKSGICVLL